MKNLRKDINIKKKHHNRIIKSRRIHRMSARFITVLSVFLLIFFLKGAIKSFAGAGEKPANEAKKYYTSIMIYPGDSVESLADRYYSPEFDDKESLACEILSINNLSPENNLQPGNHIIVPFYK